ncbi:hypothetical protein ACWGRK_01800 [Saccharomonospora azurea]|uniref:Uncharacterized protein n=1 Tax=Saccharomonospora azurea NA-128 TaxID=882081 RepID=H8GD99_9PSEU|nr:hypothetical protein [Saccharomonospora azurea]EHY89863.1 hypothetical protein SacazDRAFT_02980 [Saccharomonospora azurea NA-128]
MIRTRRVLASAVLTAAALSMGAGAALAAPPETTATPTDTAQTEQVPQHSEAAKPAEEGAEDAASEEKPAEEKPTNGTAEFTFSSDMTPMDFVGMLLGSGLEGTVNFEGDTDTEA